MLGDMLMQLHKPAEALAEYQKTLTKEPNRYRSLAGAAQAAADAGDRSTERQIRAKLEQMLRQKT